MTIRKFTCKYTKKTPQVKGGHGGAYPLRAGYYGNQGHLVDLAIRLGAMGTTVDCGVVS